MIRDVFYYGKKPNVHPREKFAKSFEDAKNQATTDHFWIINEYCDYRGFDWDYDFDFLPDDQVWTEDHINIWPSQHQKDSGTWLCANNDSEIKIYLNINPIKRKNEISEQWIVKLDIDTSKFDFSWHPDPTDPPYIYVFGNQWYDAKLEPTIEYHVSGAVDKKYISDIICYVNPIKERWKELLPVENFDFSWRPHPYDPPYIYVFGNQWHNSNVEATVEYYAPNATEKKYVNDIVAYVKPNLDSWETPSNIKEFDYSWRPQPHDPPFIYQFGTQWQKTGGPRYVVDNATEIKYISHPIAYIGEELSNWEIPENFDKTNFDFSWHPDALSPPYIYKFSTILDDINLEDGPTYQTPNNNGHIVNLDINLILKKKIDYPKYLIETTLNDLIDKHKNETFWAVRDNINYTDFNFDWRPTKENVFHINVFGSPESETTQTYFVNSKMISNGFRQLNFIDNQKLDDEYLSKLFKPMDMFFVDKSNSESQYRYEQLKQKFPNIKKTRYLNSWVDTINRCLTKCETELCWILNSELDYTDFDFNYYPNPWQMKMVHVFGTQWSHWGTTFVVNKDSFPNDTKYVKIIEHLPNINFVKKSKAKATNCLYDIYYIDYENDESSNILESLRENYNVNVIKYNKNYLETFKNLLDILPVRKDHYIWVCSSICNYQTFDFTYICDPFALEQLHVFPSDKQKYGDTFFVNVNKLRTLITDLEKLEDYNKISFNQTLKTKRVNCPTIVVNEDTHTEFMKYSHNFPYAVYVTHENNNISIRDDEPISLWSESSKNIVKTSTGASRVIIPKEAQGYIKKELYDYPYIISSNRVRQSTPLDIVFLSNGETCAEENFEYLKKVTRGIPNRITRVDGVNGRVAAYHAAANASNTPWMFTVFAKLRINHKFDWSWQPDRLQIPKHYIFHATNPVNGLEYGHQAMIAYNKKITLSNIGKGLDFTLDDEHEVVPLNSGVATFNTDEFSTWRTAFREAIKLRNDISKESRNRLEIWLNVAGGDYAEYSIKGAKDAVAYYEEVNGNIDKLRLSYEWDWLKERFNK